MAPLGENFRGNQGNIVCPLCHNHLDNQSTFLQCEVIKKELEVKIKIEDIYGQDIKLETARKITEVAELREKMLQKKEIC